MTNTRAFMISNTLIVLLVVFINFCRNATVTTTLTYCGCKKLQGICIKLSNMNGSYSEVFDA